jgi:DNA-binding transcriptional MerR regulator
LVDLPAKRASNPNTVRFYERSGLLPRPSRAANGYRLYNQDTLRRLRFIKQAQALGFSLDEIRHILNLRGRGKETCRCVLAIAETTLTETEQKIYDLQRFRDALVDRLASWRKQAGSRNHLAAEFCALIESAGRE